MEPEKPLEEQNMTPSEVWSQLDPELRARVVGLLARMAYKHLTARPEDSGSVEDSTASSPPDRSNIAEGSEPSQ
jgi:hypothetical protein